MLVQIFYQTWKKFKETPWKVGKLLEFDINFDTHDFCPKNEDEKREALYSV